MILWTVSSPRPLPGGDEAHAEGHQEAEGGEVVGHVEGDQPGDVKIDR